MSDNTPKIYAATNSGILCHISTHKTILDIGCGSGYLSEQIKKKGNTVYGIDYTKEAVEVAVRRIDYAALCDIEKEDIPWNKKFDVILFADILEHLYNPKNVIERSTKFLKKDGVLIISLPNIANWSIRSQLFFGNFTRTETGILDKTHIHFYTLKTAKGLLEDAGLIIERIDVTPNFFMTPTRYFLHLIGKDPKIHDYEKILQSSFYHVYLLFVQPLELFFTRIWKSLFAYQFVFVCRPKNTSQI